MANNHNFPTVVIDGAAVAGSCSKCGLSRNELLDNAGILMGCQFPDSHQQGYLLIPYLFVSVEWLFYVK